MRLFETNFLTTEIALLGIGFFGGDNPLIAKKILSTVLV
jgi:hypothetical protein